MALEREGIQLVAEGAAQFIQQMTAADATVTSFIERISGASRIRTAQLAPDIQALSLAASNAATSSGQLVAGLQKLGKDTSDLTSPLSTVVNTINELVSKLGDLDRVRTTDLTAQLQAVSQAAKEAVGQAGALRNQTQLASTARPATAPQQVELGQRVAIARTEAAQLEQVRQRQIEANRQQDELEVRTFEQAQQRKVAAAKAALAQIAAIQRGQAVIPSFINIPSGSDQLLLEARRAQRAQAEAQAAARATPLGRITGIAQDAFNSAPAQRFAQALRGVSQETTKVTEESLRKNKAINEQTEAEGHAGTRGVTYLSVLSAIHAASFLASNQTFTTAGSLATLTLAFSKVGPAGVAAGAGFGILLFGINSLDTAFGQLVNVASTSLQIVTQLAATAGAAVASGVGVAVQQASGLETSLALVRAVGQGTDEQLGTLRGTVESLSREFGVSQQDVSTAASLYVRAGGNIEGAINGATRAVIQLTIASQGELGAQNAARAVAQITNAFAVGPKEAADFVAGLAQRTTLSFTEVTQALQQVGPAAANLKIPLSEVGAAIGVAAEAGLRGTVAGSGLKQVFLDLAKPSATAAKLLRDYNISLFDVNGNVRPLADVFGGLNRAFGQQAVDAGRVTDAQRAYALATIFGSRAGQAAAIIANQGADAFLKMQDSIDKVTATDIADQLLIPTAKQLDITKQNALAFATALGGPLNTALGGGLANLNEFLKGISTQPFEVAGQAIVALATGQGFGALATAIDELGADDNTRKFIDNVLNTLLNARDAVVTQIIPAFQTAGGAINEAFQGVDVGKTLNDISRGARNAAAFVAILVTSAGDLTVEFIKNEARGATLRSVIEGLAVGFGVKLVGGLALAAIPMAVTVTILDSIGKAVLSLLDELDSFTSLWDLGWQLAARSISNFLLATNPRLLAFGQVLGALAKVGDIGLSPEARVKATQELAAAVNNLNQVTASETRNLSDVNDELLKVQTRTAQLQAQQAAVGKPAGTVGPNTPTGLGTPESIQAELNQLAAREAQLKIQQSTIQNRGTAPISGLSQGIKDARAAFEAARTGFDLSDVTARAEGDLTDMFTRITQIQRDAQDALRAGGGFEEGSEPGFLPTADKTKTLTDQIVEFVSDMERRIANVTEDGNAQIEKIVLNGLERFEDEERKFGDAIVDLRAKTAKRIADIKFESALQRAQRDFTDEFKRDQEDQATTRQENLDVAEQDHRNFLDDIKRQRGRDTEDVQRGFDIQQQIAQQAYSNIVSASDVAFKRVQRGREQAFTQQQSKEEQAFTKGLKAEADARQLAIELGKAKTPEERTNILAQSQQAKLDADFQESQDKKLADFRLQQQKRAQSFSDSQEDQAFARRLQQQVAEFQFRLQLEVQLITFRRGLEDGNVRLDRVQDLQELFRRQGLARQETTFRRGQQFDLLKLQDQIADFNQARQVQNIQAEAKERERVLARESAQAQAKNAREVFEQIDAVAQQQGKSVRGVLDSIADKRDDFIKNAQKNGTALPPEFFQLDLLESKILEVAAAFDFANTQKKQLFGTALNDAFNGPGGIFERVPNAVPSQAPLNQQLLPATASTLGVVATLAPGAIPGITQGFFNALVQAGQQGVFDTTKLQQPLPPSGVPGLDDAMRRALQGVK